MYSEEDEEEDEVEPAVPTPLAGLRPILPRPLPLTEVRTFCSL